MRQKGWIAGSAVAVLLLGVGAVAGAQVRQSCYVSADGIVSWSAHLRRLAWLDFDQCDPFADDASQREIGTLEITASFEGRETSFDSLTLIIKPDGSAILGRRLQYDGHDRVISLALSRSDYAWFRDRLAPFRDYVDTNIANEPLRQVFKDPARRRVWCETTDSLHANGIIIGWTQSKRAPPGTLISTADTDVSAFDLGCQGPAGDALRDRLEPVVERLFRLENAAHRQATDP